MKKFIVMCCICSALTTGCADTSSSSVVTYEPKATQEQESFEQRAEEIAIESANRDDESYEMAKQCMQEKKYKEAYELYTSLSQSKKYAEQANKARKKLVILEFKRVAKWKGEEKNIIAVLGNTVELNIKLFYITKDYNYKHMTIRYKGKIVPKKSTTNEIAIKHNGKLEFIFVGGIFDGCISYSNKEEKIFLYSVEGKKQEEKEQEEEIRIAKEKAKEEEQIRIAKEKAKEEEEKRSDPSIGMTASEVEASTWGKPEKKNISEYSWGTKEQWVYSGQRYVYLNNGIVTSIQRSE